jgi:hypothetical protein
VLDDSRGRTEADLIADDRGQFRVDHDRGLTATRIEVRVPCGWSGRAFEVSRHCHGRPEPPVFAVENGEVLMLMGASVDGRLAMRVGASLHFEGPVPARLHATESGIILNVGDQRLMLGPKGLLLEGDLHLTGKIFQA